MEDLDPIIIEAVVQSPVFNDACEGDRHTTYCVLKHKLCALSAVSQGFRNKSAIVACRADPQETMADFFCMGFLLAREY